MNDLPSDVYYNIASFFSTSDAFIATQINQRWNIELYACSWLWRIMRIDYGQLYWGMTHRYNTRTKRKRDMVIVRPLLQLKGVHLHKLVIGAITEVYNVKFDHACLATIAAFCLQLRILKLFVSNTDLTHHSFNTLVTQCPQLTQLALPVCAISALAESDAQKSTVATLQLHGEFKLHRLPHFTCLNHITTLKLTELHNCIDLSVILFCPLLQHLSIVDCTSFSDEIHPAHVDPTEPTMRHLCNVLQTLNIVRCHTVVCIPHLLLSIISDEWAQLHHVGIDNASITHSLETYERFYALSCNKCDEVPVYKHRLLHYVQATRCASCSTRASKLKTIAYF